MTTVERSASSSNCQRGVSRVLAKLDNSIEQGEYYEAHQMYRTLYFRYTTQRKFNECLELLLSGASKLLEKHQETSSADLSLLIIDTLEKRDITDNINELDQWIERLCKLITGLSSSTVERDTLIQRAVKWSGAVTGNTVGHPTVHKIIAQMHWSEGNNEMARHHFLLCHDGNLCGRILVQISESKGFKSEVDLFIVQAVLQQLCLKEHKIAEDTFNSYTANHPQLKHRRSPYNQPLLNYVFFLLRIIEFGNLTGFQVLMKLYEPSIIRDPSFEKYLGKIGVIYFNAQPAAEQRAGGIMGGMFGDLFSRLFQGLDDDEDEDTQENQQQNTQNTELD